MKLEEGTEVMVSPTIPEENSEMDIFPSVSPEFSKMVKHGTKGVVRVVGDNTNDESKHIFPKLVAVTFDRDYDDEDEERQAFMNIMGLFLPYSFPEEWLLDTREYDEDVDGEAIEVGDIVYMSIEDEDNGTRAVVVGHEEDGKIVVNSRGTEISCKPEHVTLKLKYKPDVTETTEA